MSLLEIKMEATPSVAELMSLYDSDTVGVDSDNWTPGPNDLSFPFHQNNNELPLEFSYGCPPLSFSNVPGSSASFSPSPGPSTPGEEDEACFSTSTDASDLNCKGFVNFIPSPTEFDQIQRSGTRKDRRRQQNRLAQKKYRARKERLITDLQEELDGLRRERDAAMQLNARLMMEIRTLRYAFMPGGEGVVAGGNMGP